MKIQVKSPHKPHEFLFIFVIICVKKHLKKLCCYRYIVMTEDIKNIGASKQLYEKYKDSMNKKIDCDICGGHYSKNTRYNHFHSKKHMMCEKDKKIQELEDKIDKDKKIQELEKKIIVMNQNI